MVGDKIGAYMGFFENHSKSQKRMSISLQTKLVNVHANLKLQHKLDSQGANHNAYFDEEEYTI